MTIRFNFNGNEKDITLRPLTIIVGSQTSSNARTALCKELWQNDVTVIRMPEANEHPWALVDWMDRVILNGLHEDKEYVIETFSDVLLYKVQSEIRNNHIHRDMVAVYWVDDAKGVLSIEVAKDGDWLHGWPDGLFEVVLTLMS